MSDRRLIRAVGAEVAAFRPGHAPPFAHLLARKRARDRRRALAGALAVAGAVAAVGLVVVPAISGGQDNLESTYAGPTPTATEPRKFYVLRYANADAYLQYRSAVDECLALPGTSDARNNEPTLAAVMVFGADQNKAFASCIAKVKGVTIASAREYVWADAPWAVQQISQDRRSVTVRAYDIVPGCTGEGRVTARETRDGIRLRVQVDAPADPDTPPCHALRPGNELTVVLPRPLRQGETVLGECVPNNQTTGGKQCQRVRESASLPPLRSE